MSKVALYGGSFNPPHLGHAMIASFLAQFCGFDEVWLLVSPENPLKSGLPSAAPAHRLEMCRLVANAIPRVKASDFEFSLPTPNYTYLTLRALTEKFPEHEFSLVVGSDNWNIFEKWRRGDEILSRHQVWVYQRPDCPVVREVSQNVRLIENAPLALISSSFVRKAVAENKDIDCFVPKNVADYIKTHHLYEQ